MKAGGVGRTPNIGNIYSLGGHPSKNHRQRSMKPKEYSKNIRDSHSTPRRQIIFISNSRPKGEILRKTSSKAI